ncbi:MAG: hypothetical protein QXK88_09535 [Desulfurococcaceae archaeon]
MIDKDLGAERMATALHADVLMILTDIDYVYLNYGTPDAKPLKFIKISELLSYYSKGHFKPGSMGPKVLAAARFIQNGGEAGHCSPLEKRIRGAERGNGYVDHAGLRRLSPTPHPAAPFSHGILQCIFQWHTLDQHRLTRLREYSERKRPVRTLTTVSTLCWRS